MDRVCLLLAGISTVAAYAHYVPGNSVDIPSRHAMYGYVIVGGGTAGPALAHCLSEDSTSTVAVVEADGFYQVESGDTSVMPVYNQDYNYITPDSQWDALLVH
jgi:choline dehydrogenase